MSGINTKSKSIVLLMAALIALSGCSGSKKSSKRKYHKSHKHKMSDPSQRRRPVENIFIEEGQYSKKKKKNPFAFDSDNSSSNNTRKTPKIIYDKNMEKRVELNSYSKTHNVQSTTLTYNTAPEPKRSRLKNFFAKVASLFTPRARSQVKQIDTTVVASKSSIYRPEINNLVLSGNYQPNHDELIEQGSYDDMYWKGEEEINNDLLVDHVGSFEEEELIKSTVNKVKKQTLVKKISNKTKSSPIKEVVNKALNIKIPEVISVESDISVEDNSDIPSNRINDNLSTAINNLFDASKELYGLRAEGNSVKDDESSASEEQESNYQEDEKEIKSMTITDEELADKNAPRPNLADVPAVPKEYQ